MNHIFLYIVTVLIWGSTWFAIEFQLGTVAPEVSIAYRYAIAAVLLFAWARYRKLNLSFGLREHGWFVLLGLMLFCLNYVFLRNLPHRWVVGMQPSMVVDWTASGGNKVALPVGLGFGRTIRIGGVPVQFWVEADYYPVRPDDLSGPRWGIDIQITPVISALF